MLQNNFDQKDLDRNLYDFDKVKTILQSLIIQLAQCKPAIITMGALYEKVLDEEGVTRAQQVLHLFRNGIVENEGGVPLVNVENDALVYTTIAHILHNVVRMNGHYGVSYPSLFSSLHEHMGVTHLVKDDMSRWFKDVSKVFIPKNADPVPSPVKEKPETEHQLLKKWREGAGKMFNNIRLTDADTTQYWVKIKRDKIIANTPRRHLMEWMQDNERLTAMLRKVEVADDSVPVDDVIRVLTFICYPMVPRNTQNTGQITQKNINQHINACPVRHFLDAEPR